MKAFAQLGGDRKRAGHTTAQDHVGEQTRQQSGVCHDATASTIMQTERDSTTSPQSWEEAPHAHSALPRWPYGWLLLLGSGPLLLLILNLFPQFDQTVFRNPTAHLLISGSASVLGVILAFLVLTIANQTEDSRIFLIGLGFLSTASIFAIHAIGTPSVILEGRGFATRWSANISVVLGSVFFALSGLNLSANTNRRLMRWTKIILFLFLAGWLAYAWVMLIVMAAPSATTAPTQAQTTPATTPSAGAESIPLNYGHEAHTGAPTSTPNSAPASPAAQSSELLDPLRQGLAITGLLCCAFAAVRHYQLYLRTPSPTGLGMIGGIILLGESLLSQLFARPYAISFWLYHIQEFSGFGVICYIVLRGYQQGYSSQSLLESLFLSGTRARLQTEYTAAMEGLLEALAQGSNPPVGLRERFGLTESQMQLLEHTAAVVVQERQQRQQLEQLNQTLRRLEQSKNQLVQMVVHDLKNPLTALVGFLELLRMSQLDEDQRLLLDSALRSGKNLNGLIGDLLDISRLEEAHPDLQLETFPLFNLMEECRIEMSGWGAQDKKMLVVDVPSDLPALTADRRLIGRVLLNLLSNAIKHTPTGTCITMRAYPCSTNSEQLIIEVEDNGPGIPPQYLDVIFEKFGRATGERHPRQDSTGLGLTFCRLAIESHEGTIGVQSIAGQGATFRIEIPFRKPLASEVEATP